MDGDGWDFPDGPNAVRGPWRTAAVTLAVLAWLSLLFLSLLGICHGVLEPAEGAFGGLNGID